MTLQVVPIPDTLTQALSPPWLTAALQRRFPGVEVDSVVPGPVVDRISTNARFTVTLTNGDPAGFDSRLCVKGYFNEIGRTARSIGEPEAYFYRDLASASRVRTLSCVYADVDPTTRHGVIITEDVVAQGGTFLDGRSPYTVDQAADTLTELARLHAATWADQRFAEVGWLAPRMSRTLQLIGRHNTITKIAKNFEGPNGKNVPGGIRDAQRLVDVYGLLTEQLARDTNSTELCVIHGDPHVGNLFIDPAGRTCLVDWQLVQRGRWYVDVGYHIASALMVEERRRSEHDLLRHYLESLASFGVPPPPFDEAERAIVRGVVHGFFLWAITEKVEPAVIAILLHRLGTAVADHDGLDAIATAGTSTV